MTVLIDEARWRHRDRLWCHLVSDVSLEELHGFAGANDIPRRGFHGDHYDIPAEYRQALIDAGATVVESRELIRRLKLAGLRLSPAERRAFTQPPFTEPTPTTEAVRRAGRAGS